MIENMKWQDIVIAITQIGFIFSMLPSIRSKDKPALLTSVLNVILVSVIATCLLTLHLWLGTITAFMIAGTWAILAVQKSKKR